MTTSLFSPNWYRVAALKPRLRSHIEVHRQPFRKELAFLLQDHVNGKFYQFNANANEIVGRMNGDRTVHDIWVAAMDCLGDDAPTQDEIIALLGRLHHVSALQMNVTPDCAELFSRARKLKNRKWRKLMAAPLMIRMPLLDPDRLLRFVLPVLGPLFTRAGLAVWLVVVLWALTMMLEHWSALSFGATDRIFETGNIGLIALIYTILKACHELGHAVAARKWGGEVHEMGITLLVFMPVPYVDTTAATAIQSKYRRMLVSAAGIMVELFLAAIALAVWLNVEPGLVRLIAFDVMVIGCVSTLLFNGNPLLRFDAYYILKDAIEVPNLASRSTRYILYLVQRHVFSLKEAQSPSNLPGERGWLLFYGIASSCYRLVITLAIALYVANQWFIVGVLLAGWAVVSLVGLPVARAVKFVLFDASLSRRRFRAAGLSSVALVAVIGSVCLLPVSYATRAEGVLWLPQEAQVRTGLGGTVKALLAEPFSLVEEGQPLLELIDHELIARLAVLAGELDELRARHRTERLNSAQAAVVLEQISSKQAELAMVQTRADGLIVRSGTGGIFVLRDADGLPGRVLKQGDRLGFVLDEASMIVRVVVPQDRIGLIRESLVGVEVKLAEALGQTLGADVTRYVPAAQEKLPSRALGSSGGGTIPVDPADEEGMTPASSVFHLDLRLEDAPAAWRIGQRAYVRFDHGDRPLVDQWLMVSRQLFLRQFGV